MAQWKFVSPKLGDQVDVNRTVKGSLQFWRSSLDLIIFRLPDADDLHV
jgi:hypothetical protein